MADPGFLAFSLTAGAAATLNPCGFALLPGYVAYVLGRDEGEQPGIAPGLVRGAQSGAAMTLGVLAVFAAIGAVVSFASRAILAYFPWATIVVGAVVLALGVAMLLRRSFDVGLPFVNALTAPPGAGQTSRSFGALLLFGAGYGIASLGCTLPIFLVVVTQALTADGFASAIAVFLAYGLGMGAVLLVLSLAVALGKNVIVRGLRRVIPYVRTIGALGLILAGGYLIYYQVTVGSALLAG